MQRLLHREYLLILSVLHGFKPLTPKGVFIVAESFIQKSSLNDLINNRSLTDSESVSGSPPLREAGRAYYESKNLCTGHSS